ncbi:MAG: PHP domain-containing protein [Chloroflexota bacterium]|nr:PHP domain-containing protein [Chloroflexota bacterium]
MRADLHIHTIASDGCWPPEQVVAEVKSRSIDLFAVTDHDTIASVPAAEALAREAGLAFLRGVEVSASLDSHLFHILAYGFDPESPVLTALLRENRAKMEEFNGDIIHALIGASYPIDADAYAAYEYDPTRGGWKGLNFLIDARLCTGVRDFFDNLMAGLSLEMPTFPHPAKVVSAVREAGGAPILAHPGMSLRHVGVTDETLRPLLESGISGLECYSQYHDQSTIRSCLDWCTRHDLLVTGGSDCHGGFVGREVGVPFVDTAALRLGKLEERIIRASYSTRKEVEIPRAPQLLERPSSLHFDA